MAGRLVLVFDDGSEADYAAVRPVLNSLDAPACFAVVPDWLGRDGHLDPTQVRALADAGHEIAAHGRRHRHLQRHALAAPVTAGDDRLPLDGHVLPDRPGGVCVGDEYEVVDGDIREVHEVAATHAGDDPVVEFEAALASDFDPAGTVVRVTEDVLADETRGAKRALSDHGVEAETFVFPYDAADPRAWRTADAGFGTIANTAVRSLPNPRGTPGTNLRRYYLETTHLTRVELREYLDSVAERGGLGVLAGHSAWESVTRERVRFVVEAARERGVEVATFRSLREEGWL